ncbi:MAG: hypothetical protein QME74_04845 [Candidatus Edwardsbacteria bacterium]|nr:hypothetical protein [Candidatus Edwardsbacteria bacterium]
MLIMAGARKPRAARQKADWGLLLVNAGTTQRQDHDIPASQILKNLDYFPDYVLYSS